VIQRIGHWLLDSFGTSYIVPGFTPEALLALGFWPALHKRTSLAFGLERFQAAVPDDLVHLLMPGLEHLEQQAAETSKLPPWALDQDEWHLRQLLSPGFCAWGPSLSCRMPWSRLEQFPENPVHALLAKQESFR